MQRHPDLYNKIKEIYRNTALREPDQLWPPDIRRALDCINSELFEYGFCVQVMRERCRIYQNNFAIRFRYFTGETPSQYIKKHRVECAKKLLEVHSVSDSVYGVALEVGYEYPSTFCGAFKNHTGMTPAGYRNMQKKK